MRRSRHLSYTWMSRGAYKWVMSHINESCREVCHIWMSHVAHTKGCLPTLMKGNTRAEPRTFPTCECVMAHMNESCHILAKPHMNESCHERVVSHKQRRSQCHSWKTIHVQGYTHCAHTNGSWHMWISHITLDSRQVTHEWIMSHKQRCSRCHSWKTTRAQDPAPCPRIPHPLANCRAHHVLI